MVGGGQQAPCQALSHTAVLAKMGVGAASATGRGQRQVGGGQEQPPTSPGRELSQGESRQCVWHWASEG